MRSLNPAPEQLYLEKLIHHFNILNKGRRLDKMPELTRKEYLQDKELKVLLQDSANRFRTLEHYKSKAIYNNNLKTKTR